MIQNGNGFVPYGAGAAPVAIYPRFDLSVVPGRIINSIVDMRPQDVPVDGNIAVFPQADKERVFIKFWDKDCNLQTLEYVRTAGATETTHAMVQTEPAAADYTAQLEEINKRLTALESKNKTVSLIKKE